MGKPTKERMAKLEKLTLGQIPHHPLTERLYRKIADLDLYGLGDSFCFKSGGDGDNGEALMALLDLALEDEGLVKSCDCGSNGGDAWKCAKRQNLPSVSCHCACHRYIKNAQG